MSEYHEDAPKTINEIHIYYDNLIDKVTKMIIRDKQIYRYQDLDAYIKQTHKVPYEFELISDGKLLHPLSDLFASGGHLDVIVAYKYIRNTKDDKEDEADEEGKEPLDIFFKMRSIKFKNEILKEGRFQQCLEEAKRPFTIDSKELKKFKREIYHTFQKNAASKGSLIKRVLEFAIEDQPFFLITNEVEINDSKHLVKADHTVSHTLSERKVMISQDKDVQEDLFAGVIQNFDQLKTYSLTSEGQQYPFVYGVTSNFNDWMISCYYVPKHGVPDSKRNFHVSKKLSLMGYNLEIHNIQQVFQGFDEKFNQLVGFLRGLCRYDIDITVAKKLGLDVDFKQINEIIQKQIQSEEEIIMQEKDNLLLVMDQDILTSHLEGGKKFKADTD